MACSFCATGRMGLVRSLTSDEILAQAFEASRVSQVRGMPPLTSIVFMGMGEPSDNADAVLEGELKRIEYRFIRGSRVDSAYPEELANTVTIEWTLRDAKDPGKLLAAGSARGTSQLFVSSNLQTARNNALPEALDRASEALVSRLAIGY